METIQKRWFIKEKAGKIEDFYLFNPNKPMGEGATGAVFSAKHRTTKFQRAIKRIPKRKVKNSQRLINEISILRDLDHPNIIRLFQIFEDEKFLYLVMELCEGGELFERLVEKEFFDENEAKHIFTQIVQAVSYCHSHGVCHRDLKPENFLLLDSSEDSPVKVIDFGFSALFEKKSSLPKKDLKTKVGTPYYVSPEVLEGRYNEACDIWSLGVILYMLLSGVPPFDGENELEIVSAVKSRNYTFEIPEFQNISKKAQDLIRQCLQPEESRIKAAQVLEHEWLKETEKESCDLDHSLLGLKEFVRSSKFKRIMLSFFASQLNETDFGTLAKAFKSCDVNGDGYITVEEVIQAVKISNPETSAALEPMLEMWAHNKDWKLNYTEFLASSIDKNFLSKEGRLIGLFKLLDTDGSGKINKTELKAFLGKEPELKEKPESFWDDLIKEADKNGDGEIDYDQFVEMVLNKEKLK